MSTTKKVITRRDFIRTGSCVAVGGLAGLPLITHASIEKTDKSRVILIRDKNVIHNGGSVKDRILENILDEAMTTLLDVKDSKSAWQQLFSPDDIVGIKTNAWGPLPTPKTLESALRKRLINVGVKKENIDIDDRGIRRNPVFKTATALINVRPLRTHHWSGLGTLLKNYIMFASTPWRYHGRACERLGHIWNRPEIKDKTRLNILVLLAPLFHGVGPHHFSKTYVWFYGGLIVSTDPVAADAVGARIIQSKRNEYFKKYTPISPPPRHIEAADKQFGVGNSSSDRIELIKMGWKKDALI